MHRAARLVAGLGATLLIGIGMTACSGTEPGRPSPAHNEAAAAGAPAAMIATAATNVADASSAKVSGTAKVAGAPSALRLAGTLSWADDIAAEIDVGGIAGRFVDDVMYLRLPGLGGGKWIKQDLDDLAVPGATGEVIRAELRGNDPASAIAMMKQASDIELVGTEVRDDTRTTHFSGTVELATLVADHQLGLSDADIQAFRKEQQAAGVRSEKIDVWLNGKQLPVHMEVSTQGKRGALTLATDCTDYGVGVDITAPPPSDVLDLGGLTRSGKPGDLPNPFSDRRPPPS